MKKRNNNKDIITKKCIFCKSEIDREATVCPVCKREQAKKSGVQKLAIIFVLLILVIFIAFIMSVDENGLEENIQKNVGDELVCDKYKVVVNEFKFKTGSIDSFQKVPDGTEWIGIIVTATNTSEENINVYSSNFEITNSNGEILEYDAISYKVWGNYDTFGGELAPGGTKTGYIAFTNPNTDNSNLTLKFKCGTWQSGSYIIPLK